MNLTLQADVSPTTTRYSRMVTDVIVIHILMLVPPIFSPFFPNTLLILMKKKNKKNESKTKNSANYCNFKL